MLTAIQILQLLNTLEPAAVALIKNLLTSMQGKTTEQILAEADSLWDDVITTANNELNPPPAV